MQYDQRGRTETQRLTISTSGGLCFPTFPQYQEAQSYNDANQLTTTQTTVGGQAGYTFTQAYDSTTSVLNGLSNTTTGAATLVGLTYNAQAQISALTLNDSNGSLLATEQLSYDADLRLLGTSTSWQSNGATIFSDGITYDAVGNVISRATTQASLSGVNGSGGSEVQNFCYDEQNRLVWAGNSGTQPAAGNGSCGAGTLSSGINGAAYATSYVYTHLGQLWQGPLNGTGTQEQYLYCASGQPHQVTLLAAVSSSPTCSTTSSDYSTQYDAWGNVTSSTTAAGTGTFSYDGLDRLRRWNGTTATNSQEEWYLYDSSGNRVLRRSASTASGGNPATAAATITVYAFGLEEHQYQYSGTGSSMTTTNNTYYYMVGGRLLGMLSGVGTQTTSFLLTDTLGSITATISNTAGNAQVMGNQVYGPYGNQRATAGTTGTAKGFTGQYHDDLTGLDYYVARYYDPLVGLFLSADSVQGNLQGMNPYAYVNGNPETYTDPTGQRFINPGTGQTAPLGPITTPSTYSSGPTTLQQQEAIAWNNSITGGTGSNGLPVLIDMYLHHHQEWVLAESYDEYVNHQSTMLLMGLDAFDIIHGSHINWNANQSMRVLFITLNGLATAYALAASGTGLGVGHPAELNGMSVEELIAGSVKDLQGVCSFTPATVVMTQHGEQPIGTIRPGEKVLAYNPQTHKMEWQPVKHVWVHTDNDLVDVTIMTTTHAPHSTVGKKSSEVIHTNQKHPFYTLEYGFVPVRDLKLGMHVLRADGQIGVVTGWKVVPGAQVMYNLEVAQDHTFTVGTGQWVVHNCQYSFNYDAKIGKQMAKRGWTPDLVQEAIDNPDRTVTWSDTRNTPLGTKNNDPATVYYKNGGYVVVNDVTHQIVQVSDLNDPNWLAPWGTTK